MFIKTLKWIIRQDFPISALQKLVICHLSVWMKIQPMDSAADIAQENRKGVTKKKSSDFLLGILKYIPIYIMISKKPHFEIFTFFKNG